MDTIAMRFLSKYGNEMRKWSKGSFSTIKGFDHDVDVILGQTSFDQRSHQQSNFQKQSKILDSIAIINLSPSLQKTAISLLSYHSASAQTISQETGRSVEEEEGFLSELMHQGYIFRQTIGNEKIYYVS